MEKVKDSKWKICLKLFLIMFVQSACTFGGGFVIISMLKKKFVDELGWIEEDEMMDFMAIAQSTPGALAINMSIVVGYRIMGIPGVVFSVLGAVLPPFIIISLISVGYNTFKDYKIVALVLRFMRAGVAAVILDVAYSLASRILKSKQWVYVVMMIFCFIFSYFFKINVVVMIVVCGLLGMLMEERSKKK